jgi:drug/metabolite transporter (DMT)-like permease
MVSVRVTALGVDLPNAILRSMAWGTLGSAVGAIAAGQHFIIPTAPEYWVALLWLSSIATVGGSLCYLTLVNRLGAAKAGYVTVLFPFVALSLSTFLEGYRWHWTSAAGVLFILLGCLLVFAVSPDSLSKRINRMRRSP